MQDVVVTTYQDDILDDYEDVFNFSNSDDNNDDNNDDYSTYKEDVSDTGTLLKQKEDELQSLYEKDSKDIVVKKKDRAVVKDKEVNKDEYVVDNRTTTDKILNWIIITLFSIFILLLIAFIIFVIYICTY